MNWYINGRVKKAIMYSQLLTNYSGYWDQEKSGQLDSFLKNDTNI